MSAPSLFATAKAKKSLGQHFLRDERAIRRIVELLDVKEGEQVLEIGPGPGALTAVLRRMAWSRLLLLEKDEYYAREHAARPLPGMEVITGDALVYPWEKLEGPWKIVGNLPYNVASPLMWELFSRTPCLARAVFMVQKEVADRLLAAPGGKDFGALAVWTQSFVKPRKGFVLGPTAFSPPPGVDSAVVLFDPLPPGERPEHPERLARLIKICFQQRRKQIQNILRHAEPGRFTLEMLDKLGIDRTQRPETLDIPRFHSLATALFS